MATTGLSRGDVLDRLALPDPGRELATEFVYRHRLNYAQRIMTQHLTWMDEEQRLAVWIGMVEEEHRRQEETIHQRIEV